MRYKRSERIVFMTQYLMNHPNKLIPLTYFVKKFKQAKSSISEDVQIIKNTFQNEKLGTIITTAGASGGVTYKPMMSKSEATEVVDEVIEQLQEKDRLLPGGYLFLSDLVGNPSLLNKVGKLIASIYMNEELDAVVTIATKGISLANAVANVLNLPVVVIRKDNKVTEGSTVSINYVSGSSRKIETMVLSKRTLAENSNVLVVDDFMRAGGSINGVMNLMNEFKAHVKGVSVLVESKEVKQRLIEDYTSLVRLSDVDEYNQEFKVEPGNSLSKFSLKRSVKFIMKIINSDKVPEALGPYSHATVINGFVFTSGQIPLTLDGTIVSDDVQEQTKQVLENLTVVLKEAGSDLNSVVKATIYISDMNDFQQINQIYGNYFVEHQPARSCVEVSRLPKDVKVEIELIGKVKEL